MRTLLLFFLLYLSSHAAELSVPVSSEVLNSPLISYRFAPKVYILKTDFNSLPNKAALEKNMDILLYEARTPELRAKRVAYVQQLYPALRAQVVSSARTELKGDYNKTFTCTLPATAGYILTAYREGSTYYIGTAKYDGAGTPDIKWEVHAVYMQDMGKPWGFGLEPNFSTYTSAALETIHYDPATNDQSSPLYEDPRRAVVRHSVGVRGPMPLSEEIRVETIKADIRYHKEACDLSVGQLVEFIKGQRNITSRLQNLHYGSVEDFVNKMLEN